MFWVITYKRNMYYSLISSMKKVLPVNPLWTGLKAYYTGDNTANDALGVSNGTLTNGATYATGKINNGFSLDGTNDFVDISPSFGNSFSAPGSAHSYNAWVYPTNVTDAYNFIIQNGDDGRGTSMILATNKLGFFYQGGQNVGYSSATLSANTWSMVTVVYNGSGSVSFYINGTLSNSVSATWTDAPTTAYTWIGGYRGGAHLFNGTIDEVSAWTKALTATDITELYNSGSGKQYPL